MKIGAIQEEEAKMLRATKTDANMAKFFHLVEQTLQEKSDTTWASWYDDKGKETTKRTFGELWSEAGVVAYHLIEVWKIPQGKRVVLCYDFGLHFFEVFLGCLRAGVTPVMVYPPGPPLSKSLKKLQNVIDDCSPELILTDTKINWLRLADTNNLFSPHRKAWPDAALFQTTDKLSKKNVTPVVGRVSSDKDLAFLQYTSGSTGTPKGVMVTFGALIANVEQLQNSFKQGFSEDGGSLPPDLVCCVWLPQYHDLGLICGAVVPFVSGWRMHMMSPLSFIKDPLVWLKVMSDNKVAFSPAPDFSFRLVCRKFVERRKQLGGKDPIPGLDLSSIRGLMNCAEPIRLDTNQLIDDTFSEYGLRKKSFLSGYGLAEHIVSCTWLHEYKVSAPRVDPDGAARSALVAVGSRRTQDPNMVMKVVDPTSSEELPDGKEGELWVSGPSVAAGYFGKPELSNEVFGAKLKKAGAREEASDATYLRTGDLAFWEDDYLYICGRIKDLIIINGANYYPQDVEVAAQEASAAVRPGCVAAFACEDEESGPSFAVVFEVRKSSEPTARDICAAVRTGVIQSIGLVPTAVLAIKQGTISKTTSGKIQRSANKIRFDEGKHDVVGILKAGENIAIRKSSEVSEGRKSKKSWFKWFDSSASNEKPKSETSSSSSTPGPVKKTKDASRTSGADRTLQRVKSVICELIGVPVDQLPLDRPLAEVGMTSMIAVELSEKLSSTFGREVPIEFLFGETATAQSIADILSRPQEVQVSEAKPRELPTYGHDEPIAVVGMACRLPGGVSTPEEYWKLLVDKVDAIQEVPLLSRFYDPNPQSPGKTNCKWAGQVDDIELFDPAFFHISRAEAPYIDPQVRMLLECSWETFEECGLTRDTLRGSNTGVYVGLSGSDYENLYRPDVKSHGALALLNSNGIAPAGRISYTFDLQGPNMTINTACSSSLVAVHQACQSLRSGDCNLAVAAGVNIVLDPEGNIALSQIGALSPTGRCHTFSVDADGYVRSTGCGVLLLKPLGAALSDGDRIRGVIRGSAVNQDGLSQGLSAPNGNAQVKVIKKALSSAGVVPSQVGYVECHGTGTRLGDPIEVGALGTALGSADSKTVIGSVKSNIGHTEAAAGIAGLMKALLCLENEMIPATLHCKEVNPLLKLHNGNLQIAKDHLPWPAGINQPRYAGVSSFGISGTNAHLVIGEAPLQAHSKPTSIPAASEVPEMYPIVISAKSARSLTAAAAKLHEKLVKTSTVSVADIAFALATNRTHFGEYRVSFTADSHESLLAKLESLGREDSPHGCNQSKPLSSVRTKLCIVFTGQGSQRPGMGKELYVSSPVFKTAVDDCARHFAPFFDHAIKDVMFSEPDTELASTLARTDYTQAAIFTFEFALVQLWASLGVRPDMVAGHSIGEIVAATVAEVFSLEDACKLVAARGGLMQSLPSGKGGMIAVRASEQAVRDAIAPVNDSIDFAAINAEDQTVLSGPSSDLQKASDLLASHGIQVTQLNVSNAFHSRLMEPILGPFGEAIKSVELSPPQIEVLSAVTGKADDGTALATHTYWERHIREPVRFADAMDSALDSGATFFLEVGCTAALLRMTSSRPKFQTASSPILQSSVDGRRRDNHALADAVAALYSARVPIDLTAIFSSKEYNSVSLPSYAFDKSRYWRGDTMVRQIGEDKRSVAGRYYDDLLELMDTSEDETYITFGLFEEIKPGFSHILTMGISELYERHGSEILASQRELRKVAFRHVKFEEKQRLIDVGCGVGSDLLHLGKTFGNLELHGFTISPEQAKKGNSRFLAAGVEDRVQVWHADSSKNPFPSTYDVAIGFEVVHHIPDKDGCFSNLARHMEHEGLVVLADFISQTGSEITHSLTSSFFPTSEEWTRLFSTYGFRIVDIVDVSTEVSNFLYDPNFDLDVEPYRQLADSPDVKNAMESYNQLGIALGKGFASYVLLTAMRDEVTPPAELERINSFHLTNLIPHKKWKQQKDGVTLLSLEWEQKQVEPLQAPPQRWLFVGGSDRTRSTLSQKLVSVGHEVLKEDDVVDQNTNVLVLCGVTDERKADQQPVPDKALHLSDAVTQAIRSVPSLENAQGLVVLTEGAQSVVGGDEVDPGQCAMYGLLRSVGWEFPEVKRLCIDIPKGSFDTYVPYIVDEFTLLPESAEEEVAYRDNARFVCKVAARDESSMNSIKQPPASNFSVDPEGCYLVTGAFGGLGRELVSHLAKQKPGRLMLVSRRGIKEDGDQQWIDSLGLDEGSVDVIAADAASREDLERVFERIPPNKPLRGIFHCAGVLQDGLVNQQDINSLRRVMKPKVWGAWNLHELSLEKKCPLDMFVLYSSVASVLGSPGQSNYAAANSFLDGLAQHRRVQGYPCLSVNWGAFDSVGMASDERHLRKGMGMLKPEQSIKVLNALLATKDQKPTQIGVIPLVINRELPTAFSARRSNFVSDVFVSPERQEQSAAANSETATTEAVFATIHGALRNVVVGVDPESINAGTALADLGLDSLASLELAHIVRSHYKVQLSPPVLLKCPTVEKLVQHICDELTPTTAAKAIDKEKPVSVDNESGLQEDEKESKEEVVEAVDSANLMKSDDSEPSNSVVTKELQFECPDGARIAAVLYSREATNSGTSERKVRILSVHGWLDNAASFQHLANRVVAGGENGVDVEVVALDLPGHGLSDHLPSGSARSLSETIYYVAEVVNQLGWNHEDDRFVLVGHCHGARLCSLYAAAFPEQIEKVVFLEGAGPMTQAPAEQSTQIRRLVQARQAKLPSPRLFPSLEAAVDLRCRNVGTFPGNQSISKEAATTIVTRGVIVSSKGAQFRHDPTLQLPTTDAFTLEETKAIYDSISCPTAVLMAQNGWPYDSRETSLCREVLKPQLDLTLPGSHHMHLDPETADRVAEEIMKFLELTC